MTYDAVEQAKDYLLQSLGGAPDTALIMGSGLTLGDLLTGASAIPYEAIAHFPISRIPGHRGRLVHGQVGERKVVILEGRVHFYEGYPLDAVTFSTRVLGRMGTRVLVLTNAAGAINPQFQAGQLMLLSDHINLMGANPLRGPNEERWGTRFVDQTEVYDGGLRQQFRAAANTSGIALVEGIYAAMSGPSYETPAEVRFLRMIGADAVGMSTVPEAITARHMGMKVAGISVLANVAAQVGGRALAHADVLTAAARADGNLKQLVQAFLETQ